MGASMVLHVGVAAAVLLIVYWLAPVQDHVDGGWVIRLVIGLVATGGLLGWELRAIGKSKRPLVRATQALVASLLAFIIVFALTYLAISHAVPGSFSEHLDKVSALYFTVTTLATVGYGDITPVSHTAQILATVQMILDLIVIALTARLLFATASGVVDKRRSESEVAEDADG